MKIHKTIRLLSLFVLLGGGPLRSESQEERVARIKAAVQQKALEGNIVDSNYTPKGVVFQPWGSAEGNKGGLVLKNESVRNAAEILAKITQKEIFVSAKVEALLVSMNGVYGSRDEVAHALIGALNEIDVIAVEAGSSAIALVMRDKRKQLENEN